MRFKVGDKVRAISGLVAGEYYSSIFCNGAMPSIGGEILTIDKVVMGSLSYYEVEENIWWWADDMLEPAENKEEIKMEENNNKIMVKCHCCGTEFELTENTPTFNGEYFCDMECYDNEVATCDRCGSLEWRDEMYDCEGDALCDYCTDRHTFICDHCEERHYDSEMVSDDNICLCEGCYDDRYYRCERCGCIVYDEDTCWRDDNPYCEECADEYDDHDEEGIYEYGYKPSPIFYGDGPRYLGVELEVDKGGHYGENAITICNLANTSEDSHIYIKSDGSIDDGFEIVSHPMTLEYHLSEMNWNTVMEKAVNLGYRSHQTSTCGLHVHVNKNSLGETEADREETIAKILFFVEKHWNEIVKFTRRTEYNINRWAARYGYEKTGKEILNKAKSGHYGRYAAVNIMPYHTIEFRIFRGTLKYNTFAATLQFVNKICELCCSSSESEIDAMSWFDFVETIKESELIQYLKERKLYVNEEIINEEEM